jgi:hypothetical protein
MKPHHQNSPRFPILFSSACGLVTALFGVAAFLGWSIGTSLLTALQEHWIPMAPSTALLFIVFGFVVPASLFVRNNRVLNWTVFGTGCAGTGFAFALLVHSSLGIHPVWEHLGARAWNRPGKIPVSDA